MEDLSSHSEVFDQVEDPPDEAFSRKLALEVAEMHAEFWESPATRLPWIGNDAHRYVFPLDSNARQSNEAWPAFRADWQKIYGRDVFDREEDAPLEELTALLCGPQCHLLLDKIYDLFSSRPHTLLHGDLRASNIFRTDPALGKSVEESTLTIIDWQIIHAGPPGYEFMEAWMHSLEPAVRRKDVDLLREYHTKLVALEPAAAAYTYEMLFEDYTLSYCFLWQVIITLFGGVLPGLDQPEAAYMKDLFEQVIARSKTAMVDLDCLAPIRRFSAEIEAAAAGPD
jgi:hypothetical protein